MSKQSDSWTLVRMSKSLDAADGEILEIAKDYRLSELIPDEDMMRRVKNALRQAMWVGMCRAMEIKS